MEHTMRYSVFMSWPHTGYGLLWKCENRKQRMTERIQGGFYFCPTDRAANDFFHSKSAYMTAAAAAAAAKTKSVVASSRQAILKTKFYANRLDKCHHEMLKTTV